MEKTDKPIKKKKNRPFGFMLFLVIAFAVCLVVNYAVSYDNRMETMIVRSGSEEDTVTAEGFVFRDQTVINSPEAGYIFCVADEDQRVKTGEPVVYVYKSEINAQANTELEEIERELARLSDDKWGNLNKNDEAKIEQQILNIMLKVPQIGYESDFSGLVKARNELNELIENKRIARGETAAAPDSSSKTESLMKRKSELEAQYNIERTVICAPVAGAFTTRVDGMESYLSTAALENVSVEYIEKLKDISAESTTAGKVEGGATVGKIVGNFTWSVAAVVPSAVTEDMKVGDSVDIRFTDISSSAVGGTVTKIINEKDGNSVLVVKSGNYLDTLYSTSKANIQIVKHKYEGFRIPAKCIRMTDGQTGVYVVKNNKARFVPVNILYNTKEWTIVSKQMPDGGSTLKLYDELIISGKNLYDNKVVR